MNTHLPAIKKDCYSFIPICYIFIIQLTVNIILGAKKEKVVLVITFNGLCS